MILAIIEGFVGELKRKVTFIYIWQHSSLRTEENHVESQSNISPTATCDVLDQFDTV
jgi:hypothetical protein